MIACIPLKLQKKSRSIDRDYDSLNIWSTLSVDITVEPGAGTIHDTNIFYLTVMKHLKPLINNGTIKTFSDLLDHVSAGDIAKAIGCSVKHVETVRKDCGKLKLRELWKLSEALGMHRDRVSDLFVE